MTHRACGTRKECRGNRWRVSCQFLRPTSYVQRAHATRTDIRASGTRRCVPIGGAFCVAREDSFPRQGHFVRHLPPRKFHRHHAPGLAKDALFRNLHGARNTTVVHFADEVSYTHASSRRRPCSCVARLGHFSRQSRRERQRQVAKGDGGTHHLQQRLSRRDHPACSTDRMHRHFLPVESARRSLFHSTFAHPVDLCKSWEGRWGRGGGTVDEAPAQCPLSVDAGRFSSCRCLLRRRGAAAPAVRCRLRLTLLCQGQEQKGKAGCGCSHTMLRHQARALRPTPRLLAQPAPRRPWCQRAPHAVILVTPS